MPCPINPPKTKSKRILDTNQGINNDARKPVFSFSNILTKYCCIKKDCNSAQKERILEMLVDLSGLTWQEIKNAPRTGIGFELIPKDQMKVAIPPVHGHEKFMVFRLSNKMRMIGLREAEKFDILVIDREHKAY